MTSLPTPEPPAGAVPDKFPSPYAGRPTPAMLRLVRPIRAFLQHKLAGAGLLIAAALIAVLLANSPWSEAWHEFLHMHLGLTVGTFQLDKTLTHWINDGLMGVFFFVVGLEIKREVKIGELSTVRKALLPALAALGGMVVPALVYAFFNRGDAGMSGWGIPMATDIAFALGVLALLGDRVPPGLKVFLTALAIVDDIGAVLVIAVFYTDHLALGSLVLGGIALAISLSMNRLGVRSVVAYLVVGLSCWLAFLQSGVHATIAALLMAFTIPARTRLNGFEFAETIKLQFDRLVQIGLPEDRSLNTHSQQEVFDAMEQTIGRASAPLSRLENGLAPLVTFLVLPVFALGNAGVSLSPEALGSMTSAPVTLGATFGLLLGKPVGVFFATYLTVRLGLADLPSRVGFSHIAGVGFLAGIGFTMALFIGGLAFSDHGYVEQAKLGVLTASVVSGLVGFAWLRYFTR